MSKENSEKIQGNPYQAIAELGASVAEAAEAAKKLAEAFKKATAPQSE